MFNFDTFFFNRKQLKNIEIYETRLESVIKLLKKIFPKLRKRMENELKNGKAIVSFFAKSRQKINTKFQFFCP